MKYIKVMERCEQYYAKKCRTPAIDNSRCPVHEAEWLKERKDREEREAAFKAKWGKELSTCEWEYVNEDGEVLDRECDEDGTELSNNPYYKEFLCKRHKKQEERQSVLA